MDDLSNSGFRPLENIDAPPPIPADHGRRLANYLIDLFVFSFFLSLLIEFLPRLHQMIFVGETPTPTYLGQFVTLLIYGMFMGITEAIFRGRSPGKMITRTRVVKRDSGEPIDTQTALLRGLCRMVPFEIFSALTMPCVPWHDRWTKSRVVRIGREIPQREA